jgi:ATP-dependent DNA helicase RecG
MDSSKFLATSSDMPYFKKLGVSTLLDLALIVPSKYSDNTVYNTPKVGISNVLDATVLHISKSQNRLNVTVFANNFGFNVFITVFNPKPFHNVIFKLHNKVFLKGKLEYNYGKYTMVQPQKIDTINNIEVKYKTKISNDKMQGLIKKYLTIQNLKTINLDENIIHKILHIHFPNNDLVALYDKTHTFPKDIIYTLKFIEILNHIQKLSTKKQNIKSLYKLNGDVEKFIETLPFKLTNDQQNAIEDIKQDLQSKYVAKRVVMGDVGCGKTLVMLSSSIMAYPQKSIIMAPTTILATQIHNEALKYLPKEYKATLVTNKSKKTSLEEFDVIIGTHALLYRELPQVALVMIDEQHRFGTEQRQLLKQIVSNEEKQPHFLQFSATPIPRTLSMINSSMVDYSFIKQTPFKKDIDTFVIGKQGFSKLLEHINEEISKQHQVAIIYPLVQESETISYQSIEQAKNYWLKNFENVFVTHGKDKDKEQVLQQFAENGNILLATTVVEVGISLPKLSTIVIVGAERLGLATLHQLRGRVSRTGLKGYCYLYTNTNNNQRLQEFTKTTNGFDIANLDLKYRKAGDIIEGSIQSGETFKWFDLSEDEEILGKAREETEKLRD